MGLEDTGQLDIQTGIDSLGQRQPPGMMDKLFKNTEMLAIVMDMLGSGFDPKSPFAGIGTKLAKSSLASKAAAGEEAKSEDMFSRVLRSLTPGPEQGPTKLTAALNKDGNGIDYNVTGTGMLGGGDKPLEISKLKPMTASPEAFKTFSADDFATDFSEEDLLE